MLLSGLSETTMRWLSTEVTVSGGEKQPPQASASRGADQVRRVEEIETKQASQERRFMPRCHSNAGAGGAPFDPVRLPARTMAHRGTVCAAGTPGGRSGRNPHSGGRLARAGVPRIAAGRAAVRGPGVEHAGVDHASVEHAGV